MNQELLHSKVMEIARRNKKALNGLGEHLLRLKKETKEQQSQELIDYRREYQSLVKLSQQSEEETLRLKRELTQLDIEIEELQIRNTMSKSRIKLQSEEIENIKDETHDIDKQRRREEKREKNNAELKRQVETLEEEIRELERHFEHRTKNIMELQGKYQGMIEKKENLNHLRKENHKRHKIRAEELEQRLRELKSESTALRMRKEKESEKTKRNNKSENLAQILTMLRSFKKGHQ